jgi:hypothetical protein
MWFNLEPVTDDKFFRTAPRVHSYILDLPVHPEEVWSGLVADNPLHWCRALSGRYTSARPFGVGTTREVAVRGALKLRERFFLWTEPTRHAFYVEQANVPGLRRFAEDYQVTPTADGCQFTWRFAFEPSPTIKLPFSVAAVNKKLVLDGFIRDTHRHFGGTSL